MSKFIARLLGLLFLVFVILQFDWQRFQLIFREIKLLPVIIACFLNILRLFIETLRWCSLLKIQKIFYKIKDAFLVVLSSAYVGIVTPGRIGNFIRIFYLKDDMNVAFGVAFSSVMMDKLLELITLTCFGWWGLTLLGTGLRVIAILILSIILLFLIFLIINYKRLHLALEKIFLRAFKIEGNINKFDEERHLFYKSFSEFKNIKLLKPAVISFIGFTIFFIQAFFVAYALNMDLSFTDLAKVISLTRLIARVIPLSIFGLGSKDVAFVAVLHKNFHIEIAKGIAFSIIFLFTSYIISAITGAVCWFIKPIRIEIKK
jgi:hypothetical protein